MKLAVSNIAWPAEEETAVAAAMGSLGVAQVEIAPTKVFADPLVVPEEALHRYQQSWADHGIAIVAFQSMLFGRPDLTIFDDPVVRTATLDHLSAFLKLAGRFGAPSLVFGSPKNRIVPPWMSETEALDIAIGFFRELGQRAAEVGTCLVIEPNPVAYGCNFVTTAEQGIDLVDAVDHPGFRLHLDVAGMTLAGDDLGASVLAAGDRLRHVHISAPQLGRIETEAVDHGAAAAALVETGYDATVSIEMRPGEIGTAVARVTDAVSVARRFYPVGTASGQ